jgi:mono/diheme cytochrome c family protein
MKHLKNMGIMGATLGISGLLMALSASPAAAAPDGKAVFDKNCSVCHSVMPPPKLAPPISPIASRYRQAFPSKTKGIAHMVSFLKAPSKEKMVAEPQALERFGLMPPIKLSDGELNAVAEWVWEQGATGGWGPGSGAGRGQGPGGGIRKP